MSFNQKSGARGNEAWFARSRVELPQLLPRQADRRGCRRLGAWSTASRSGSKHDRHVSTGTFGAARRSQDFEAGVFGSVSRLARPHHDTSTVDAIAKRRIRALFARNGNPITHTLTRVQRFGQCGFTDSTRRFVVLAARHQREPA